MFAFWKVEFWKHLLNEQLKSNIYILVFSIKLLGFLSLLVYGSKYL